MLATGAGKTVRTRLYVTHTGFRCAAQNVDWLHTCLTNTTMFKCSNKICKCIEAFSKYTSASHAYALGRHVEIVVGECVKGTCCIQCPAASSHDGSSCSMYSYKDTIRPLMVPCHGQLLPSPSVFLSL